MKRFPYYTLGLAILVCVVHALPALANVLQFDRSAIAAGEWWRLFTAHLTHFGVDHLRWDLLAFVLLGSLAEYRSRRVFLVILGVSAFVITLGVFWWQPQFVIYRGLSGIDSALFGAVLADVLAAGWRERHGFSLAVGGLALVGFAAKSVYEIITGDSVFVASAGVFAPVPLAHLLGMLTGAAVMLLPQSCWRGCTEESISPCGL